MEKKNFATTVLSAAFAFVLFGCSTLKQIAGSGDAVIFGKFDGCGIQIWQDEGGNHALTFQINAAQGCITVGGVGWWGGAFGCFDNGVGNGESFNLSHIAKVTLEAKASNYGTIYFNFDNGVANNLDLGPEDFEEFEIEIENAKAKTPILFTIGNVTDLSRKGDQIWIRNIRFWDSEGNEVVPKYN